MLHGRCETQNKLLVFLILVTVALFVLCYNFNQTQIVITKCLSFHGFYFFQIEIRVSISRGAIVQNEACKKSF